MCTCPMQVSQSQTDRGGLVQVASEVGAGNTVPESIENETTVVFSSPQYRWSLRYVTRGF